MENETTTVTLTSRQREALSYLVSCGVHRSRSEAVRVAIDQYLAWLAQEGDLEDELETRRLQALLARKRRAEAFSRWVSDIGSLLEKAVKSEDTVLSRDILEAAHSNFLRTPKAFKQELIKKFEQAAYWREACSLLNFPIFWQGQ